MVILISVYTYCSIVDTKYSYSNDVLPHCNELTLKWSEFLATVPLEDYPILKVKEHKVIITLI